jgi:hypothetical protein
MLAKIYDALPGFAIWDLSDEYLGPAFKKIPIAKSARNATIATKKA